MNVFKFEGKTILIISPDKWSNLRVSKHNYAVKLAELGNRVVFLEPPTLDGPKQPQLRKAESDPVELISYNTFVKGERFIPLTLLNMIRRSQAKAINRLIGNNADVVWSFYPSQFFDLSVFQAKISIFHPVDKVLSTRYWIAAKNASLVLSVSDYLLKDFAAFNKHAYIINHGIAEDYAEIASQKPSNDSVNSSDLKFGYVGNLLRQDIDHPILLKILKQHPTVTFIFWGSYKVSDQTPSKVVEFIDQLKSLPNVVLKGLTHPAEIAKESPTMDGFLCCYDPEIEVNRASNNHKMLEYLSTGKIVVSHFVEMYADKTHLLQMATTYKNNELPLLFKQVVGNLAFWNSVEKQQERKAFALDNTYLKQIIRIEEKINQL